PPPSCCLQCAAPPPARPSSPTRRSSDLSFKSGSNDAGGRTWTQLTTDYLQQQIAIVLDSQVISAPVIQDPTPVGQATRITGDFTDRKSTRLNSSHVSISYAVFCLKKKKK